MRYRKLKKDIKFLCFVSFFITIIIIFKPKFNLYNKNVKIRFMPQELLNHLSHIPDTNTPAEITSFPLDKLAYIQYATSINYLCLCFLNFIKLRKLNTKIPNLVILYGSNLESKIPDHFKNYSVEYGIKLKSVHTIHRKSADSTWSNSFTKLKLWLETDYERIVYFDCDSIIINNNLDELFNLPTEVGFASPQAYWISESLLNDNDEVLDSQLIVSGQERYQEYNIDSILKQDTSLIYDKLPVINYKLKFLQYSTHIMVIKPNISIYKKLIKILNWRYDFEYDMEIINKFYKNNKNLINFNINPLIIPHQIYGLLSGELRSTNHDKFMSDPNHLPIVKSKQYQQFQQKTHDSSAYWFNWDTNNVMNTSKLVHFSDHPIPKPWTRHNLLEEYNSFKIACPDTGQTWVVPPVMVDDCDAVKWWDWLYDEFRQNYQDICWIEIK